MRETLRDCAAPTALHACRSINEKGLYDYLLINEDLEEAAQKLKAIAARAAAGLGPEPGMVPERVVLEDVSMADVIAARGTGVEHKLAYVWPAQPAGAAGGGAAPQADPARGARKGFLGC